MKILILNGGDEYTLGWSYKRAFEALGHDVRIFDPEEELAKSALWRNRYSRRLLERQLLGAFCKRWLPSLLDDPAELIWVGKGAWALPFLWRQLKSARPKKLLVCYNGDNPITTYSRGGNRPWITESIGCFDLFCTYNSGIIPDLQRAGAKRSAWIPFAWDPAIHPMIQYGNFRRDVLFIGNGDQFRFDWLMAMLSDPITNKWEVSILGQWKSEHRRRLGSILNPKHLFGSQMAEEIAASRITLNILRRQNEGSHNMRTFETPGCGGLMASQTSKEHTAFLGSPSAAVFFTDPHDAALKINQALGEPSYCQGLAGNSRRVIHEHTYEIRAKQILQSIA